MKYVPVLTFILVLATIVVMNCSSKRNGDAQPLCVVGKDTLFLNRVAELVPDSMSPQSKTMRAMLELLYANQINAAVSKEENHRPQASKQLIIDLKRQLALLNSDIWTDQAAQKLYDAGKFVQTLSQEKTMEAALVRLNGLFTSTVAFSDTAIRRTITKDKDSLFKAWRFLPWTGQTEDLLPVFLMLPPQIGKVLAEFVTSSDSATSKGPDAQTAIKGLLADGIKSSKEKVGPKDAVAPNKNGPGNPLSYRSQQSIKDSITRHIPDLEALYKKHLKMHQNMAGTVWVTFQISPAGNVLAAHIKTNTITEKDFLVALQDYLIEKVRFKPIPETLGSMAFEFPFDFSPEN
jgi:hypothetical protein